jgi:O-antigen/teichoic acid export membrane protein
MLALARMLGPEDFGVYALLVSLRAFFAVFKDLGLSVSIIVDRTHTDYRDLQLGLQLLTASFFSIILLLIAPSLAAWLDMRSVADLAPWLCVNFFLSAFEDSQVTFFRKLNAYRLLFWRQLIPSLGFGVTALALAWADFGVLALVLGHIAGQVLNVAYLSWRAGKRPRPMLRISPIVRLMRLGKHVTAQTLLGYLVLQADALVVGRFLPAAALGIYRMAHHIAFLLPNALIFQIKDVLFTDAAARADDPRHLQDRYHQYVLYLLPISVGYAIALYWLAPKAVPLVLGERWGPLIEPLRLMVLTVVSSHLVGANGDFGRVLGIAAHYTVFSGVRSLFTILAVAVGASISLDALLVSWVGMTILSNYANCLVFIGGQDRVQVPRVVHVVFMGVLAAFFYLSWKLIVDAIDAEY